MSNNGKKFTEVVQLAHFPQGQQGAKPKTFQVSIPPDDAKAFFFKMTDDKGYIAMKCSRAEAVDVALGILKSANYI
jgi:hypothetical protein